MQKKKNTYLLIDERTGIDLKKAVAKIRAVNQPVRIGLLNIISRHTCEITIPDAAKLARIDIEACTLHFDALHKVGMIKYTQQAKYRYYTIDREQAARFKDLVHRLNRKLDPE